MKDFDDIPALMADIGARAKAAASQLATASADQKRTALEAAADAVWARRAEIVDANAQDLEYGREKGLTDAMMDSIPIVCITGQVPTFMIGTDAFQEADTTGITRPCTKHNVLVKDAGDLAEAMHECFHVSRSGRPGPVLIDIPKDIQFAKGGYKKAEETTIHASYKPKTEPDKEAIEAAVDLMASAKKPG